MQQNEDGSKQTSTEQEGVEKGNTQEDVTEEVVEKLDTRDSKQLPQQFVHQAERIENSNFSTLPSEQNSFALIEQTAQALEQIEKIATVLIKSELCPLKKVEDVMLAIITGNQYGFKFMTSINHIFPINKKPTMSVHLHRALLLQHKIMFQKIYDYEPIYKFAIKEPNNDGTFKNVIVGEGTLAEKQDGQVAGLTPIDRITKYKFTRLVKQPDGTFETLTVYSQFKLSDAIQAGLTEKDVWVKYTPRMLDARSFGIGSKEIASDILLGIYTLNELADEYNINYSISANLEEQVLQ